MRSGVNRRRVGCMRRREALKVSQRRPKLGRLWLDDGLFTQSYNWSHSVHIGMSASAMHSSTVRSSTPRHVAISP